MTTDLIKRLVDGIIENYANQDVDHETFRVRAYEAALEVQAALKAKDQS